MRLFLAILIGKLIAFVTRTLSLGGGSAAPGLYALKLDPNLVLKLSSKIPKNIIITGTNGKTTTSRMIAHFAKKHGLHAGSKSLKVIRNHTGSNLERGIASALLEGTKLFHPPGGIHLHLSFDLGIWELDEAAFNSVAPKLNPDIVVFLNVFRDQLDRYGEVNSVVKGWEQTLKHLPKRTIVLVNGDDKNTLKLKEAFKGGVETFGVKDYKIHGESIQHVREANGLDFEATNIKIHGLKGSSFQMTKFDGRHKMIINLPIPGIYHIYDTIAAIAVAFHLGLPLNQAIASLKNFSPAFGRVEKLPVGYIFLIKNPAGTTQVFQTIAPNLKPNDRLLLALNDNLADGTDVSWIWDVNFEELQNSSPSGDYLIYASGTRAADLAVRLKYAGFEPNQITVEPDLKNALREARKGLEGTLYILPTYTALLAIQRLLAKIGVKKEYWKEE